MRQPAELQIPNMPTETPAPPMNGASSSIPAPGILLVTINRPKQRNSIPFALHWQLHQTFTWFDKEPSLTVAIITGEGDKSFCAGQDLIELGKHDLQHETPYVTSISYYWSFRLAGSEEAERIPMAWYSSYHRLRGN